MLLIIHAVCGSIVTGLFLLELEEKKKKKNAILFYSKIMTHYHHISSLCPSLEVREDQCVSMKGCHHFLKLLAYTTQTSMYLKYTCAI